MNQALFEQVDRYIGEQLIPRDEALEAALRDSAAAGLRPISVAPNQGKLLGILARMVGARRILEVGTLGGYSTIWLGAALPAGTRRLTALQDTSRERPNTDLHFNEVVPARTATVVEYERIQVNTVGVWRAVAVAVALSALLAFGVAWRRRATS